MYVCLSSECGKNKFTEIGEYMEVFFSEDDIAFTDCLFNKKCFNNSMLIYPDDGKRPFVSPKYIKFVITYINRFFCVIALTKTEYFRIEYNEYNKLCKLTHRYSKQSLLESNETIKPFIQDW